MPQPPRDRALKKRRHAYLKAHIREDLLLEIEMLIFSVATGIEDAATFADFHCFVSNQTGNTILFAVEAARIGTNVVTMTQISLSLGIFIVGGFIMGQIGNFVGVRRRWWLIMTSLFQTILVFAAVGIQHRDTRSWFITDTGPTSHSSLVLGLLAFSAGGQVSMTRALQMTEITTANATSAYVEMFIDEDLFKKHNRPRNRRIAFLLALAGGSFIGAFIYKRTSSAVTLLVSAFIRLLPMVGFLFNLEISENVDLETGEIAVVHKNEPSRPVLFVPLFVETLVAGLKT